MITSQKEGNAILAYTQKTTYTRQQISDSLLHLLQTQDFNTITVKQVVDPIHVDRSTFYRYFEDKYDLLAQTEQQVLDEIDTLRLDLHVESNQLADHSQEALLIIADFFQSHAPVLRGLFSPHSLPTFETKMTRQLSVRFNQIYEPPRTSQVKLLRDTLITIVITVLKNWVLHPADLSMPETLLLLKSALDHGIIPTLNEKLA